MSNAPLTSEHQLLAGCLFQPLDVFKAWLDLGLFRPDVSQDGETDFTVLFSPDRLAGHSGFHGGSQFNAHLSHMALQLMVKGCSAFIPNGQNTDGFDLVADLKDMQVTRALFSWPQRPATDRLMERKPMGASKIKAPSLWAQWAAENRREALLVAREHGGHWPKDILGWAHPQLMETLLAHDAPWSDSVEARWQQRALSGAITVTEIEAMRTQCRARFGSHMPSVAPSLYQGRDLIRVIMKSKHKEQWVAIREQAGPMGHMTAPYKDGQGVRNEWPLLARIFALEVAGMSNLSKENDLLSFLAEQFKHLAGDPTQTVGNSTHSMGTLAHVMRLHYHMKIKPKDKPDHVLKVICDHIMEWAGPFDLERTLACADDVMRSRLFATGGLGGILDNVNRWFFEKAEAQVIMAETPDFARQQALVQRAIARVQEPITGGRGFWTGQNVLDVIALNEGGLSSKNPIMAVRFPSLLGLLNKPERTQALLMYLTEPHTGCFSEVVAHLEKDLPQITDPEEIQRLWPTLEALGRQDTGEPPRIQRMAQRMEAMIRRDKAGPAPQTAERLRPRP